VDTLRTPVRLRSLPVGGGGVFDLGVRRDSRFLPVDPAPENYCDTTIVQSVSLQPGDVDTVSYYFRVVRGALLIRSGIAGTTIFWTRKDARETIADYTNDFVLGNLGETALFECLNPYAVGPGDVVNPAVQETLVVVGTNQTLSDTARVVIDPGRTTVVDLFPVGTVSGTLAFSDNPAVKPQAVVQVLLQGGGLIASTQSDTSGAFVVPRVPAGTFDVFVPGPPGYADTTVTGVTVVPPADTPIGTVTLTADGSGPAAGVVAVEPTTAEPSQRSGRMTVHRAGVPSGSPVANAAALASAFRAEGDLTTVWRLDIDPTGLRSPSFTEIFGSAAQIQSPALTRDLGGGVRYVAYVSDERGEWGLYVQRIVNWQADGAPVRIETPGSSDNLACSRNVFHPRWILPESSGALRLVVAMSDCPDNGFEELGFDDDPWAIGEIRLWEVELPPDF
jgi:hypothetical protein